jgi:hypothetical protein
MRPASIVQFERLFLGALALDVVVDVLTWNAAMATSKAYPELAAIGPAMVIGIMAVGTALALLLWYLAARRASKVAKWLIAIWFVLSTVLLALSLFRGISFAVPVVLGWLAYLLRAWSVSYLFKPDADAWFASKR